ncbi:MAG: chorismate synthase [Bacteroidia bacterium]|nr:chorismate synthase [Bacteroidia bacterium]
MAGSSFGTLFTLTTFGESHGPAIGGIVDGCPAGLALDLKQIQKDVDRRRPGQSKITTSRKEGDKVEILSGVFKGKTTGAPIGFIIRNHDQRSGDYDYLLEAWRPSHADFTYDSKFGFRDHTGSGRASARETACRVVGGSIARQLLAQYGIAVYAFTSQVGNVKLLKKADKLDLSVTEKNLVRCPDELVARAMLARIEKARKSGDTVGGIITGLITGLPAGLGEPVFDKLHADLGKAILSINACKGFEVGSGFEGTKLPGSEHNDAFYFSAGEQKVRTRTNHSGGVQGGISNGENVIFRAAFKPISTIMKEQETLNKRMNKISIFGKGRHDPCVLPRAVPVVEAMAALVVADHLLRNATSRINE